MIPALIGQGGYSGWSYLKRTESSQKMSISMESNISKDRDIFLSKFPHENSAESLILDYRIFNITLTAFGLEGDIGNKAFLKKVIESDTRDPKSFANRLTDKRYAQLAEALSFNSDLDNEKRFTSEQLFDQYIEMTFEQRVGKQDPVLRQALQARREIPILAARTGSNDAFWYSVLGSPSLREVFDNAFSLPSGFRNLPIDRQLTEYKARSEKMFGDSTSKTMSESNNIEKVISRFILQHQSQTAAVNSPFSIALSILRGG